MGEGRSLGCVPSLSLFLLLPEHKQSKRIPKCIAYYNNGCQRPRCVYYPCRETNLQQPCRLDMEEPAQPRETPTTTTTITTTTEHTQHNPSSATYKPHDATETKKTPNVPPPPASSPSAAPRNASLCSRCSGANGGGATPNPLYGLVSTVVSARQPANASQEPQKQMLQVPFADYQSPAAPPPAAPAAPAAAAPKPPAAPLPAAPAASLPAASAAAAPAYPATAAPASAPPAALRLRPPRHVNDEKENIKKRRQDAQIAEMLRKERFDLVAQGIAEKRQLDQEKVKANFRRPPL